MENLNRRKFLKTSAMTIAVTSTCLCGLQGCATFTKIGDTPAIAPDSFTLAVHVLTIDLSKEKILSQVGGAVKIKHADLPDGLIIARIEDGGFAIASLLCTHRGVEVEYDHTQANFKCASLGGSAFTLDGKNTGGLADRPLKKYEAVLENEVLIIKI